MIGDQTDTRIATVAATVLERTNEHDYSRFKLKTDYLYDYVRVLLKSTQDSRQNEKQNGKK